MLKKIFILFIILAFIFSAAAVGVVVWAYQYYSRDLPHFASIDDYQPSIVSYMYDNQGEVVAEFYTERRYPVMFKDIPLHVRQAFLAAEDTSFYEHPGFDIISILRAFIKNLQFGSSKQGASTITQQVIKNMLLSREKKIERKIKEAILAYRLEKRLSKEQIFELYLNQIYFGNTAYGIKSAAALYYHKDLSQVTIAEAAMLAGLPKAPSRYSPISDFDSAKQRQKYVLNRMQTVGFISADQKKAALSEELKVYKADLKKILKAPYYAAEVRRLITEWWPALNIEKDGLRIYTALDTKAYNLASSAVHRGLEEVDKRQGWRGVLASLESYDVAEYQKRFPIYSENLEENEIYPAMVKSLSGSEVSVLVKDLEGKVSLAKNFWARQRKDEHGRISYNNLEKILKPGDIIEIRYSGLKNGNLELSLDQTPELESALVLIDPQTGLVPVVIGGYDYARSQFNRATQGLRQPGSAFKPIVYFTAIDRFNYTPATIVYDEAKSFNTGTQFWTPQNYDESYLGPITLRTALEKSRNLISADIISKIGVDAVIQSARKLGIESKLGRNLSLSLGSSEVTPLEITRAYGVFAAEGVLAPSTFITRIENRFGEVIFDYKEEELTRPKQQVISQDSAFIMAHMMKGVVESGTGWRARELKRPIAAKTGTSNDQMDAWFVAYTPEWACGVWTGFDLKKPIGAKETGGQVSAPTWIYFMKPFLEEQDKLKSTNYDSKAESEAKRLGLEYTKPEPVEPLDFNPPIGVIPLWVNKATGLRSEVNAAGAILEYFKPGTEPKESHRELDSSNEYQGSNGTDYWNDPLL